MAILRSRAPFDTSALLQLAQGLNGTFTFTVTATNSNGFTGRKTYSIVVKTNFVERRTAEVNRNFMQHRADIITSQGPDRLKVRNGVRPQSGPGGSQMFGGNNVPFSVGIAGGDDANSATKLSFASSLSRFRQAQNGAKGDAGKMALGGTSSGEPEIPREEAFDIRVEGNLTHFNGNESKSKGDLSLVYVGADYMVTPGLLVGALMQFDRMSEKNTLIGSEVRGKGWMAGPYISANIFDNVYLDARALWGQSDNKTSPFGTYTDAFDTTRWQVRADLTGNWNYGPWRITPTAGISYFEEDQKAYVDSNGISIASQKVTLGRAMFGPEFGYTFKASDGSLIEPFFGIQGIWDFDTDGTTINGIETAGKGLRGKVQAGLGLSSQSGASVRGTFSFDGIGADDFQAMSGQLWVNLPLN